MSDILDSNGLQTKTLSELREELVENYKLIYGNDINTDQNTPDGQIIDIEAQVGVDLREILQQVNSGFDPDQALGRVLDQRVAINGISRNEGTYTFQNVEITTDRALNLIGLDDQSNELNPTVSGLFTVKDDAGTLFYLLESQTIVAAGTYSFNFRAAEIGQVEVIPNTITTAETVIAGVTLVNNPSSANSIGVDEETDAQLKARRRISTAISSIGFLDGLEGALNNLEGVTTAIVYENDTNIVDSDGTDPHTIWAIIEGGDPADIGEVIYAKKTAGCGMRGAQTVLVPRTDNRNYTVNFDRPGNEDLYIRFAITSTDTIDEENIKLQIVQNVLWDIGQDADAGTITCAVKEINNNYIVTGMQVSDDGATWLEVVNVASVQNRFVNDVTRITIL